MKQRYTSSEDFKSYTQSISKHIKTPLNSLRHAVAKAHGYNSVQSFFEHLDNQIDIDSQIKEYPINTDIREESSFPVFIYEKDNRLYINKTLKLKTRFNDSGQDWHDHAQQRLINDDGLQNLSVKEIRDDSFRVSGYIEAKEFSKNEFKAILKTVLSSRYRNHSNINLFLCEFADQITANLEAYLNNGGVIDENHQLDEDLTKNFQKQIPSHLPHKTFHDYFLTTNYREHYQKINGSSDYEDTIKTAWLSLYDDMQEYFIEGLFRLIPEPITKQVIAKYELEAYMNPLQETSKYLIQSYQTKFLLDE